MSAVSSAAHEGRKTRLLQDVASRLSQGRPCDVDGALDLALAEGALIPRGGFFCPTQFAWRSGREHHDAATSRLSEGLEPFFVKPHRLKFDQQQALAKIFERLRRIDYGDALPHWVTPRHIVSLYLRDAADLRPLPTVDPLADAAAVHDACVESLGRFLVIEAELRNAVGSGGIWEFPVLERYRESERLIAWHFGASAAADLDAPFTVRLCRIRRSLLFDSKPANLIARRIERLELGRRGTPRLYRVDLDMMYWECPLALELVLVFLSHPVAFESNGDTDTKLDHQLTRMCDLARALEAGSEAEMMQLVWYHLVRNFSSAMRGQSWVKAEEMGGLLVSAARYVGLKRTTSFIDGVDHWLQTRHSKHVQGGSYGAHIRGSRFPRRAAGRAP